MFGEVQKLGEEEAEAGALTTKDNPEPTQEDYLKTGLAGLNATSRTATGKIDLAGTPGKAADIVPGLTPQEIAQRAQENFELVMRELYELRDIKFTSPVQLRKFVEVIATQINGGIVLDGQLIRDTPSEDHPYRPVEDLEAAMVQFYQELFDRFRDPKTKADPIASAAWVIFQMDMVDHFFTDGCGKISKAISNLVLMRYRAPLPAYVSKKELYTHAPKQLPDVDDTQLQILIDYIRKLCKPAPDTAKMDI